MNKSADFTSWPESKWQNKEMALHPFGSRARLPRSGDSSQPMASAAVISDTSAAPASSGMPWQAACPEGGDRPLRSESLAEPRDPQQVG